MIHSIWGTVNVSAETRSFTSAAIFFSKKKHFAENLLCNFVATPNCINVHIVGTCGIGHQVDLRELCLKGQYQGQTLINTSEITAVMIGASGQAEQDTIKEYQALCEIHPSCFEAT